MVPIPPVSTGAAPAITTAAPAAPAAKEAGIQGGDNPFEKLLSQTNQDQIQSDAAIQDLVTGKTDDVQQVVMQVVKSEMSFQLFMEVRNQLIDSYNELMRMQF
ncbi:MAG: flagellar hook-basal body complex protein FliE [Pirellulaceae bacterium]|nr:flagellar hook-basal body complex protein FliE [Pirellulaceae bacterium]